MRDAVRKTDTGGCRHIGAAGVQGFPLGEMGIQWTVVSKGVILFDLKFYKITFPAVERF